MKRKIQTLALMGAMALPPTLHAAPQVQLEALAATCFEDLTTQEAAEVIAACTAALSDRNLTREDRIQALSNRAVGHRMARDWQRALGDYSEALALDPAFPLALNGRGDVYFQLKAFDLAVRDHDAAIRALQPMLSGADPGSKWASVLTYFIADSRLGRSLAYMKQGDYPRAVRDLRQAFSEAPEDANIAGAFCWSLAVLGEALEEAEGACGAALKLTPRDARALDSRGLLRLKQGRFADAWADYDAAVRLSGDEASFFFGRGVSSLRLGRRAAGMADIERAVRMRPAIRDEYLSYGVAP